MGPLTYTMRFLFIAVLACLVGVAVILAGVPKLVGLGIMIAGLAIFCGHLTCAGIERRRMKSEADESSLSDSQRANMAALGATLEDASTTMTDSRQQQKGEVKEESDKSP